MERSAGGAGSLLGKFHAGVEQIPSPHGLRSMPVWNQFHRRMEFCARRSVHVSVRPLVNSCWLMLKKKTAARFNGTADDEEK